MANFICFVRSFLFLVFLIFSSVIYGQNNIPEKLTYPDTLKSNQDSFYIISPRMDTPRSVYITSKDTMNFGTYGYKGVFFTIWTDLDTIVIPHVNYPERQLVTIPVASLNDTTICILRFQATSEEFSKDYMSTHRGKVTYEIPASYELANVILYLSELSVKTSNHPQGTAYTSNVESYFSSFRDHDLIKILNKRSKDVEYWDYYYGFRENSICFVFDQEGNLKYNTPYKDVWYDPSWVRGGEFRNLLYLIQDFVNQTKFHSFYQNNLEYYKQLSERQEALLPINQMWEWLENEFPNRIDSYKIIFSPLIGGSHSTQNFQNGFLFEPDFKEAVMFINSSERIDRNRSNNEAFKEILMSGVVFTEIDHNYVNPMSDKYKSDIKSLMADKDFWATNEAQKNYSTEYKIFNEYMTHALFCLYVKENYNNKMTRKAINNRVNLMNRRGFVQFDKFNSILLELMVSREKNISDSYRFIISAMKQIKDNN